jgi:hypothetical protein
VCNDVYINDNKANIVLMTFTQIIMRLISYDVIYINDYKANMCTVIFINDNNVNIVCNYIRVVGNKAATLRYFK